jgi:hypothetical protein
MKKQLFVPILSSIAIVAALIFGIQSCKKDEPCDRIVCAAGGHCVDGTCIYDNPCAAVTCPTGTFCDNGVCIQADPCNGINCLNGGTCINGACSCATGDEGVDCGTEVRSKFTGVWKTAAESCSTINNPSYDISITTSTGGILEITISNLFNISTFIVTATVNGNDINIPAQTVGFSTIQGTGTLNGSTITLTYTMSFGATTESCSGTDFIKQ